MFTSISRRRFCACCAVSPLTSSVFSRHLLAQERVITKGASFCAGVEIVTQDELWLFESSAEAKSIIREICEAVGIAQNFEVRAAAIGENFGNAAAVIIDRETNNPRRLIVYNERWVQSYLRESGENYWAGVALLAHECGHHLNGHTLDLTGSQPARELESDYFSGFVVGRLGGTLAQAEALFNGLPVEGSATHPPRRDRLHAAAVGWTKASAGGVRTTSNDTSPTSPNPPAATRHEVCALNPNYAEQVGGTWVEGVNKYRKIRNCGDDGQLYEIIEVTYADGSILDWFTLTDPMPVTSQ